jgi:hypothetical protein
MRAFYVFLMYLLHRFIKKFNIQCKLPALMTLDGKSIFLLER